MIPVYKIQKHKKIALALLLLLSGIHSRAQLCISADGSTADPSAMVEVKSAGRGMLLPRMTTLQRDAINTPAEGLTVYNTDEKWIEVFDGEAWKALSGGFRCGLSQIEDQQGNTYSTAMIGTQCWMADNLNTGILIDSLTDPADNGTIEKHCYHDQESQCNIFGGLYTWDEMMNYTTAGGTQGICPTGWHIPTPDEWAALAAFLGGNSVAGGAMKTTGNFDDGTGLWYAPNTGATNISGFSGLPSGYLAHDDQTFYNRYVYGYFWSSALYDADPDTYARAVWLYAGSAAMEQTATNFRVDAYAVRCIKNK